MNLGKLLGVALFFRSKHFESLFIIINIITHRRVRAVF
jgi:hypothetical protein